MTAFEALAAHAEVIGGIHGGSPFGDGATMVTTAHVVASVGSASVGEAVATFRALDSVVSALDLATLDPDDLVDLTAGVRAGQRSLERLVVLIGMAAERHAAASKGRGAHGTLLGDGRQVRGRDARREADRARVAATLSKVGAAVGEGRIGAVQVDAIARAATALSADEHDSLNTDAVIEAAATQPADVFAKHVRHLAERIKGDEGLGETRRRQARSSWKHWFDEGTGMGHVHGEFDPERYEAIIGSVERELTRLANRGEASKDHRLAADAAFVFADRSVDRQGVRAATDQSRGRLGDWGVVLDPKGVPVDVGRRHRTATDAQWQAVRSVYRTCAWSGCDRPLTWCQLHHIHECEDGGPTDLCNLIPLCHEHHHHVHEGGWSVKLHPDDRRLAIVTPDGRHHATTRPDRIRALPERHRSVWQSPRGSPRSARPSRV